MRNQQQPLTKTTSKQNNNECRGGKERVTRSKKGMLSEKNGRGEGGGGGGGSGSGSGGGGWVVMVNGGWRWW